jgi:spore coat protein U-like protein
MLVLCTRPAAALLCGSILDPITVSATPLSFGVYLPGSASAANTTIKVSCTIPLDLLTDFTVSLSAGNAATPATRLLRHGGDQLGYNIFADAGYMTVWGDGSAGSVTQGFNSLLALGSVQFTGFGRLPQGQYVPAGAYSDRITVTVAF